jgi:hypothetical protein
MARVTLLSRTRRPSTYPASRWNSRCSGAHIPGVAVEQPVFGCPVTLRGNEHAPFGARYTAFNQMDVGFLAGFDHPQLGVYRGQLRDHPVG